MANIADQMRDDLTVDMVCQRENSTHKIELCYFNKTTCAEVAPKLQPWSWIFGEYVF
eukprot:CAMPEP_0170506996 /NCGR_PEP_ID=MMETSP0208-20121228/57257_1 /TAXON_ID=197538 /ORGANISM="Strombidium inclinatum, Strain S3" /LENGTH=56 /DNA_ID=CAMNT_0010788915 /DNA_START=212 /DNA_END=382 /DNA_ORIENTATION=+